MYSPGTYFFTNAKKFNEQNLNFLYAVFDSKAIGISLSFVDPSEIELYGQKWSKMAILYTFFLTAFNITALTATQHNVFWSFMAQSYSPVTLRTYGGTFDISPPQ